MEPLVNSYNSTISIDATKDIKVKFYDAYSSSLSNNVYQQINENDKGHDAIIIAFDCTDRKSFDEIENAICQSEKYITNNSNIYVVATKTDLSESRVISDSEAKYQIQNIINHNLPVIKDNSLVIKYFETSAKNNQGIENLFVAIAMDNQKSLDNEISYTSTFNKSLNTQKLEDNNKSEACVLKTSVKLRGKLNTIFNDNFETKFLKEAIENYAKNNNRKANIDDVRSVISDIYDSKLDAIIEPFKNKDKNEVVDQIANDSFKARKLLGIF